MADQDEPRQAEPEEPTATPEPEDDTTGHNMGTYEYARQHAEPEGPRGGRLGVEGSTPQAGQEPARPTPRPLTRPTPPPARRGPR